jgi:hypothetical protein
MMFNILSYLFGHNQRNHHAESVPDNVLLEFLADLDQGPVPNQLSKAEQHLLGRALGKKVVMEDHDQNPSEPPNVTLT